jgi:hypothetical protein
MKYVTIIAIIIIAVSCQKQEMAVEKVYTRASVGNISTQQISVFVNNILFEDSLEANQVVTGEREIEFRSSTTLSVKTLDGAPLIDTVIDFKKGIVNKFYYMQGNPAEKGVITGGGGDEAPPQSTTARKIRMINLVPDYPDSIDVYFYNIERTAIVGELKKVRKDRFSEYVEIETRLLVPTNPNSARSIGNYMEIKDSRTGVLLLAKEKNKVLSLAAAAIKDRFHTIRSTGTGATNSISFSKLFSNP